jgi:hypothetical protein
MTDESSTTETAAETETRKRGRPTIAELEAREAALKEREEEIAVREREAELQVAEANAALREADLIKVEAKNAAGRSGTARGGDIRSADLTQPVRRRRYTSGEMPNEFHIPEDQIPDGISYQWNNHTVFGMNNPSADAHMAMQGWQPVPASRHPHLVQQGADPTGPILVKGQILMERPMELTQEALQEDYDRAMGEVAAKERQLHGTPPGTLPRARANGSAEFNSVKKQVEPGGPSPGNYTYENAGGLPVE